MDGCNEIYQKMGGMVESIEQVLYNFWVGCDEMGLASFDSQGYSPFHMENPLHLRESNWNTFSATGR